MTAFNDQGYSVDDQGYCDLPPLGHHRRQAVGTIYHRAEFSLPYQPVNIPLSTNGVWLDLLNGGEFFVEDYGLTHYLINSNWGEDFFTGRDNRLKAA